MKETHFKDAARTLREPYQKQWIAGSATNDGHFRITDTRTDSRVATCYLEENASLVVAALNAFNRT